MPARRILVVDDEGTIRRIVADMLSLSGFDVVQAEDAGQAVDVARETPPDLLLSDLSLPDGDGCEVLRAVREIHPEVRAVVMTGLVDSASAPSSARCCDLV